MTTIRTKWAAAMMAIAGLIPLGCGSGAVSDPQPPGCPTAAPKPGDACSAATTGCSYQEGPCEVGYSCSGPKGTWQVSGTTTCSPTAKECWSAQEGDVCALVGDACGESE